MIIVLENHTYTKETLAVTGIGYTHAKSHLNLSDILAALRSADGKDLKIIRAMIRCQTLEIKPVYTHLTKHQIVLARTTSDATINNTDTVAETTEAVLDVLLNKEFDFKELMPLKSKIMASDNSANFTEVAERSYDLTKVCKNFVKKHLNRPKIAEDIPKLLFVSLSKGEANNVYLRSHLVIYYDETDSKISQF